MATTSGPRLVASNANATVPNEVLVEDEEVNLSENEETVVNDQEQMESQDEGDEAKHSSTPGSAKSGTAGAEPQVVSSALEFETDLEIDDKKEDFDISGARLYMETCRELGVVPASYFIRHMTEQKLRMRHHGLGPLGAKAIAIPLISNTWVYELDLEDNWIESTGAIFISDMLKENCYITHLNLANNKIGTDAAKTISEMLLVNSTLTHINLSGNGFQPKDAKFFTQVILENSCIKTLDLSHNSFGDDGGDILGHAVGENETLEKLDFSWNNFRRESGIKLLDGIQVNSRLKFVNLAWNGLGLDCAPALSNCLKMNSILTELDVSSNRITQDAMLLIAKGLEANETLQTLRIGRNPIGAGGALALLSSVNNERSILTLLDLSEVWVEKEFEDLFYDIRESRQDFEVKHAGVMGMFSTGSKKSGVGETDLEKFLKNDPMAIIKLYLEEHDLRYIDIFTRFDKNKDYLITPEEFTKGVQTAGIALTENQVNQLIESLDSSKDPDGKINYKNMF